MALASQKHFSNILQPRDVDVIIEGMGKASSYAFT